MISSKDIPSSGNYEKDLVADQTYKGVNKKLNTGATWHATKGLGIDGTASSVVILAVSGGMADCRVTATMVWGDTSGSTPSMQVCARLNTVDTPLGDQDWYCARIQTGQARITKIVSGTYTNITSSAFSWTAGDVIKMTLECVGSSLAATFENVTTAPGVLTSIVGTDSSITAGGAIAFRTLNASMWLQYYKIEHL